MLAIEVFKVNHRVAFVGVALAAGLNASLATYAPRRVNEEFHVHVVIFF
jgi:hypothetical protein